MIGIVTPYANCDATAAALQIADWLAVRGRQVSIGIPECSRGLSRRWDHHVCVIEDFTYLPWIDNQTHTIWTAPSPWLLQPRSTRTKDVVLFRWRDVAKTSLQEMRAATVTLAPSREAVAFLQERRVRARFLPWSVQLPPVVRGPRGGRSLLLPLHGRTADWVESEIFPFIEALADETGIDVLVVYTPSAMTLASVRQLRRLEAASERVFIMRAPTLLLHSLLYLDFDWVLWPCVADDLCLTPLTALRLGARVAVFDVPPLNNLPGVVRLPCATVRSSTGLQRALPDYARGLSVLAQAIRADEQRAVDFTDRDKMFDAVLGEVLDIES